MTSDRWRHVEATYHAALERPAAERDAFLGEACAGDDALQREVRSLDQQSMPGFLSGPAIAVAAAMASERPGTLTIAVQDFCGYRRTGPPHDGPAFDPVWSSAGNLIVYAGANLSGRSTLLAVRPDETPVELPPVQTAAGISSGGHRFLPDGRGVVFGSPKLGASIREFWLLNLAARTPRRLAELTWTTGQGGIKTFDITPDGRHIVFDRSENSDIVLIDLPQR